MSRLVRYGLNTPIIPISAYRAASCSIWPPTIWPISVRWLVTRHLVLILLSHYLGGNPLATRKIFMELQEL